MDKKELLLDKYTRGNLNDAEEQLFKSLIQTDKAFANEVRLIDDLKYGFAALEYENTKSDLKEIEKELNNSKSKPWKWAAVIAILLTLGGFVYQNLISNSEEKLFASYFEPYRNVVYPTVRSTTDNSIMDQAFTAYENLDYQNATVHFESLLREDKNDTITFYLANSYMQLSRSSDALALLQSKNNSVFEQERNWYIALAYLQQKERQNALTYLRKVLQGNGVFMKKEAQELIQKLD